MGKSLPKIEKFEKHEHKEKPEKFEHKEKPEKHEHKEKPEKHEHKEKPEKLEHKEKPEIIERIDKLQIEGPPSPIDGIAEANAALHQRVSALEAAVSELRHFIPNELRPDLSRGSLKSEPDTGNSNG